MEIERLQYEFLWSKDDFNEFQEHLESEFEMIWQLELNKGKDSVNIDYPGTPKECLKIV